jgi:hypothetical protein
MSDRDDRQVRQAQQQTDAYIRSVAAGNGQAGSGRSSTEEIARAKELLDSGAITPDEFTRIKQQALAA